MLKDLKDIERLFLEPKSHNSQDEVNRKANRESPNNNYRKWR